jgi:hypothetical protein
MEANKLIVTLITYFINNSVSYNKEIIKKVISYLIKEKSIEIATLIKLNKDYINNEIGLYFDISRQNENNIIFILQNGGDLLLKRNPELIDCYFNIISETTSTVATKLMNQLCVVLSHNYCC